MPKESEPIVNVVGGETYHSLALSDLKTEHTCLLFFSATESVGTRRANVSICDYYVHSIVKGWFVIRSTLAW